MRIKTSIDQEPVHRNEIEYFGHGNGENSDLHSSVSIVPT